jgi:transcriptional regulator with XRE-family HTH domain
MKVRKYIPSPEGALLRAFRTRAHLTQHELSNLMGVSSNIVSLYEGGHARLPYKRLHQAVEILDLTVEEMQQLRAARKQPWQKGQRREIVWEPK